MFVFETSVEHQLELTLGASVQFKPLQGQIRFLSYFNSIDIRSIKAYARAPSSCLQFLSKSFQAHTTKMTLAEMPNWAEHP